MTATGLPKFVVGQSLQGFPGHSFNQVAEAVEQIAAAGVSPAPFGIQTAPYIPIRVSVNTNVARYGVLSAPDALQDPQSPSDNNSNNNPPVLAATAPTANDPQPVIALESINAGRIGHAVIVGATWADIDIQDVNHNTADVIAGDVEKLESAAEGAVPIRWKPTGTGIKRCVVVLGAAGGGVTLITSTLTADTDVTDTTTTVDDGAGGDQTVNNTFGCCGDDGDECVYWNDGGTYRLLTVLHKKIALVTDVRIQSDELEYVTRNFAVMTCGTTETEVKIVDVGACT